MSTGVQRADAPADAGTEEIGAKADWSVVALDGGYSAEEWQPESTPPRGLATKIFAGVLIVLALAWVGAAAWLLVRTAQSLTLATAVTWIPAVTAPLAALGFAWLVFGRSSRRETDRFRRSIAAMRNESAALESLLAIVATRLEENHTRLTNEAAKLMSLGDEAADRLGRVTHYLAKESVTLDKKSEALEEAAAAARVDIGVLLNDLPRAEEQARAVAEAMKEAGLGAHEQAGALEGQLSALIARGREADEVVNGAAQRLAAHLARIETSTESATSRIEEAAVTMNSVVDESMTRASEAVEAARTSLETQGSAVLAMIDQSRAALEQAGEDSARNLGERLEAIGGKIEHLAEHLAAQDAASHALVSGLSSDLAELDQRFASMTETGVSGTEALEKSVSTVRQAVELLYDELNSGADRATTFIGQAQVMAEAVAELAHQLNGDIPAAFAQVEDLAGRTREAAASITPEVEAMRVSAEGAAARIAETEAGVERQRHAWEQLVAGMNSDIGTTEEQLRSLGAAAEEANAAARKIVADTGPDLIDALVRVRETAQQAAERAREAIAEVIPASVATLGEASREAVIEAVSGTVTEQLGVLTELAERAVVAARKASERLTRQMLAIGKTTAAIEARIEESHREHEEHESQNLSRKVALLIESLNSTAIDVTKILSNEVTDTAWTAYLRGDRGVFTRRAVRLLSSGEARAIAQHYEEEPEFREQVNRYIHDFEAMLRRVLADREGFPLGVTLLSSDMGKLYVALAQAIERLR